ncbi:MAG TPA: hypothetical protein VMR34_01275 [Candidatus Saccharimonadales bacterium]|nr:hypothetical protein [Candidatus Saccharimonadales bacterium]
MMSELRRYLWLSQVILFSSLIICSLIIPSVVIKNGGVSNFGNHISTVGLYALGFLSNIAFIYLAASSLLRQGRKFNYIVRSLVILSALELIVFISTFPRHFSFTFSDIHDYLGIALFSYEFILSLWIVFKNKSVFAILLLLVEATGSIVGLLSAMKVIHFLFFGQVTAALAFGLLLCLVFPKAIEETLNNQPGKT